MPTWNYDDEEINGIVDANIKDSPPSPPGVNTASTVRNLLKAYWQAVRGQVSDAVGIVDSDLTNTINAIDARATLAEERAESVFQTFSLADGLGTISGTTGIATIKETGFTYTPVDLADQTNGKYFSVVQPGSLDIFSGDPIEVKIGGTVISRGTKWDYIPPSDDAMLKATEVEGKLPTGYDYIALALTIGSYYNQSTGAVVASTDYKCAEISYSPGDVIKVSGATNGSVTALAIYLNDANTVLGRKNQGVNSVITQYTNVALDNVPVGTTKIRITSIVRYPLDASKFTKLAASSVTRADNDLYSSTIRLNSVESALSTDYQLVNLPVNTGYMWHRYTTALTANAAYKCVEYPYTKGDQLKITGTTNGSTLILIIYINEAGQVLAWEYPGTNSLDEIRTDVVPNVPNGTAKILISGKVASPLLVKKKLPVAAAKQSDMTSAQAAIATAEANISALQGSMPADDYVDKVVVITTGQYYNRFSGAVAASAAYKSTSFAYDNTKSYRVTAATQGSTTALAIYLDASNAVIGVQGAGANGVEMPYLDELLVVPAGTVTILVDSTVANPLKVKVTAKSNAGSSILLNRVNVRTKNPFEGLDLVIFGTSITATGWPQLVGELIGAKVYNEGVGSSMARRGKLVHDAGDAYGWTGLAWQNVARSLSQTLAEKNELITNWDTWKTKLTNAPPAALTAGDITDIQNYSYENKLVAKHLGAGKRRKLYIFDHGHNDNLVSDSDNNFTSIPVDSRNRDTYVGAMNFLIDQILADDPRARICFIGHYENARKTRISQAQQALAEYWDFPLLKLWERLGWSQQQVQTTGYWSDALTWNASGGALTARTMTQIWMQDDLHPTSQPAKELIAKHVASWLTTVPW